MSHSHAESTKLPCQQCGRPFSLEIWIVVDVVERPDLLAKLRAGTLHHQTCPACGHVAIVNAPLLVHRPVAVPELLFSPAQGGSPEQDEEQAQALIGLSRENFGAEWRDEWLDHGLTGVAREALPTVLADDPATAAGLAAAHYAEDEVPPGLRRTLEEIIVILAGDGVRVTTAEELQRAVETRPALKARLVEALRQS